MRLLARPPMITTHQVALDHVLLQSKRRSLSLARAMSMLPVMPPAVWVAR